MHFLVIEGVPNIVMVNIATLHISLLLARTSIFVSQKLVRSQFLVLVWILTAFITACLLIANRLDVELPASTSAERRCVVVV